jgi:hypothetical protein
MKITIETIELNRKKKSLRVPNSYKISKFSRLPILQQLRIKDMLRAGYGVYEVMRMEKVLVSCLIQILEEVGKVSSTMKMGNKTETYATEEEMINGFQCTYNDLSKEEKLIYQRL